MIENRKILIRTGLESSVGALSDREPCVTSDTGRPVLGTVGGPKFEATEQKISVTTLAPVAFPTFDRSNTALVCDLDVAGGDIAIDIRNGAVSVPSQCVISAYGPGSPNAKVTVTYATGQSFDVTPGYSAIVQWDGLAWYAASTSASGISYSNLISGLNSTQVQGAIDEIASGRFVTGDIKQTAAINVESGWYRCDGAIKSRVIDADLFNAVTSPGGNVLIDINSPATVTLLSHGFRTGNNIEFTTTGALPTGLLPNVNYFVIYLTLDTFALAGNLYDALNGNKINTTGTQSGIHSVRYTPFGVSGAAGFILPDMSEATPYGIGGRTSGVANHDILQLGQFSDDQMQGHQFDAHVYPLGDGNEFPRGSNGASGPPGDATISAGITIVTDGVNGTPRLGQVTRGKIIGMYFVIKA